MRIPQQVSDRVKEAPAQVLRAVFAGVGQVLLVADRVRTRAADNERHRASATAQPDRPARPAQPRPEAAPARPAPAPARVATRWRSLDVTGNVRLLSRDEEMEAKPPAVAATPAEQPSDPGLTVLPVANYDGLTIPSLRARLRNLDPAQLRVLIEYEKAHAGRGDVLTMFERRIAKLETGA
jgi:hypothetical protein